MIPILKNIYRILQKRIKAVTNFQERFSGAITKKMIFCQLFIYHYGSRHPTLYNAYKLIVRIPQPFAAVLYVIIL